MPAPAPQLIVQAFAASAPNCTPASPTPGGKTNPFPVPSQIGVTNGAASYTDGFPQNTMKPIASGGTWPFGEDMNGILFAITSNLASIWGGQLYQFNATWAADNSGYAAGAVIQQANNPLGFWVNLVSGNTNNPDTGGSGWTSAVIGWQRTAAEISAGVTPTNYSYQALDVRRYGADPTGTNDSTTAFNNLLSVLATLGGGSATIWPGTYKITSTIAINLAPASGGSFITYGCVLDARGVTFNYTGSGYAFDFSATNTGATYGFPLLEIIGANLLGTSGASGGWRTRSLNSVRWYEVKTQGFTAGPAWTLLNDVNWSENCHWRGCAAVNCQNVMAFAKTGGTNSFARTYVDGIFAAGITGYWFVVGGGCAVYDSRFTHLSGNFGGLGLFLLGATSNDCDMSGTVVDGLDYECNGTISSNWTAGLSSGATSGTLAAAWPYPSGTYTVIFSDAEQRQATYTNGSTAVSWAGGLSSNVTSTAIVQQSIVQIANYPGSGVARRPVLTNIGPYATFINSALQANFPIWTQGNGAAIAGPETAETQAITTAAPLNSLWGQSSVYEPNFNVAATRDVASYDQPTLQSISLNGFGSAVSGRVALYRVGNMARLRVYDTLTGTSNANTLVSSALPQEFWPSIAVSVLCFVEDNGNFGIGAVQIGTAGVMTFYKFDGTNFLSNGFTTSGTKGLVSGWSFGWDLA